MMMDRAGSSDLPVRYCGLVLSGAFGQVVGIEERRNTGTASGGRSLAAREPEAAAGLG